MHVNVNTGFDPWFDLLRWRRRQKGKKIAALCMTIACLEDDEVEGIRNKGLDRRAEWSVLCSYRNRNGGCRPPIQCIRMDVNSTPFVALLSFSLNVTCLNFFAVSHFNCCPCARRFAMSERHWKLINIVFIVAKLGNTCFGRNICIRKQKCF